MNTYDYAIIDTANLLYRLAPGMTDATELLKKIINFIEIETKAHLTPDGKVYLLFDPLKKSTLNEEKSFIIQSYSNHAKSLSSKDRANNARKKINPNYKAHRTGTPLYAYVIENLMKFFAYRGEEYYEVYGGGYEADDYVEPLIACLSKKKKIALVSTDEDYSRYLDDHVFLINKGYDEPWTREDFKEKYQFYPTPASVTLYKAFFGDKSDEIEGCVFLKRAKFLTNIRKSCLVVLQDVADRGISLDEFLEEWKKVDYKAIVKPDHDKKRTPIESLFIEFTIASQREAVLPTMSKNITLIRSLLEGKDVRPFIHFNPINEKFNEIQRRAIFDPPKAPTTGFGRVKVSKKATK